MIEIRKEHAGPAMLTRILTAIAGLALLSMVTSAAYAEETSGGHWYVGGGLGGTTGMDLCSAVTPGFTTTPGTCDSSQFAGKVFGGYQLTKYLGAEGALVYLGTADANGTYLGTATTSDVYAGGLELVGTGTLPITDKFSALGKLGVLLWGIHSETGTGFDRDDSGASFAMGAGLQYDITKHVGIRFEWERFWQVGNSTIGQSDVDMFTIGGLYRF
jgi:OOP family OmpA-OmpF porin